MKNLTTGKISVPIWILIRLLDSAHPASEKRRREVDAIRRKLAEAGEDRFAIQRALMPYETLLPKKYRGRNERLYERFEDDE